MGLQLSFKKPKLFELVTLSSWGELNLVNALCQDRVIGAYLNDALRGFLVYSRPDWCIEDLVVHQESRRIGLGRSLIRELVARVPQGEKIFLEVRSKNIGAIALYKSENFIQVGIRCGYYGDDDAIIMERVV